MIKETGGSAFPNTLTLKTGTHDPVKNEEVPFGVTREYIDMGMSMRDYFAEGAPVTLRNAMEVLGFAESNIGWLDKEKRMEVFALLAQLRLEYADAMIVERAK
jgi:hypothetical protein